MAVRLTVLCPTLAFSDYVFNVCSHARTVKRATLRTVHTVGWDVPQLMNDLIPKRCPEKAMVVRKSVMLHQSRSIRREGRRC